jgi:hypothetical protein
MKHLIQDSHYSLLINRSAEGDWSVFAVSTGSNLRKQIKKDIDSAVKTLMICWGDYGWGKHTEGEE